MVGVSFRFLNGSPSFVRTMTYADAVRYCNGLSPIDSAVMFTHPEDHSRVLAVFDDIDRAIEWLSTRAAKLIEKGLRPVGF